MRVAKPAAMVLTGHFPADAPRRRSQAPKFLAPAATAPPASSGWIPAGDGADGIHGAWITPIRRIAWREVGRAELSRFDPVGATTLAWAEAYPPAPAVESPYRTGETTHGPAFQLLTYLRRRVFQ